MTCIPKHYSFVILALASACVIIVMQIASLAKCPELFISCVSYSQNYIYVEYVAVPRGECVPK